MFNWISFRCKSIKSNHVQFDLILCWNTKNGHLWCHGSGEAKGWPRHTINVKPSTLIDWILINFIGFMPLLDVVFRTFFFCSLSLFICGLCARSQCSENLIQSATTSTINIHRSSYSTYVYPRDMWVFDWMNVRVVWCAMCAGFFFCIENQFWWWLCSRVDVLRALQEVNRDRKPFAQGTYFIRGKIKTSASIKSRFTRSSYSWALPQLDNCCRFKSFLFFIHLLLLLHLLRFSFRSFWFSLIWFGSVYSSVQFSSFSP